MKILGIGNAIVDVICKVDDEFIKKNNLTKSTMKLIFDEKEFKQLLSNLKIEKTVSGGSVANSIVGLSQLGNDEMIPDIALLQEAYDHYLINPDLDNSLAESWQASFEVPGGTPGAS